MASGAIQSIMPSAVYGWSVAEQIRAPQSVHSAPTQEVGVISSDSPQVLSSLDTSYHSFQVSGCLSQPTSLKWSTRQLKVMFSKL